MVANPQAKRQKETPKNEGGQNEGAACGERATRVACLLPSATEIMGALGLGGSIIATTHECDLCPDAAGLAALSPEPPRVTSTAINPHAMGQAEIDDAVKRSAASGLSLYAVDQPALLAAMPDLVITQALCAVCAVDTAEVNAVCVDIAKQLGSSCRVLSLQPTDLPSVAESFETVASACGVPERGAALRLEFERQLQQVSAAVDSTAAVATAGAEKPSVLLLEWLDPVFDAGHWVPGQIEAAGCRVARLGDARTKSTERNWAAVVAADPDCILVGCCGFDAERNRSDVLNLLAGDGPAADAFRSLRAVSAHAIRATDLSGV